MGILANLFGRKVQQVTAPPPTVPAPPAYPTPLGLVPGSVWTPYSVDISLAQADGSIIVAPQGEHIVDKVGLAQLWGMDVYSVYFQNSENFLQVVTPGNKPADIKQLRLFTLYKNVLCASKDDIEFWLGKLDRDAKGNLLRDKFGNSRVVEPGLIGWPQFQIDGPPALVYDRQWTTTEDQAIAYAERIRSNTESVSVGHQAMEYARRLTSDANSTVEYLLVTFLGTTGTVKVYVGVDLDPAAQTIISVA